MGRSVGLRTVRAAETAALLLHGFGLVTPETSALIKGRPHAEQTHASSSRRAQLPEAHAFAAQQRGFHFRHVQLRLGGQAR